MDAGSFKTAAGRWLRKANVAEYAPKNKYMYMYMYVYANILFTLQLWAAAGAFPQSPESWHAIAEVKQMP